jgi:archaellum component FlaF (FlaF/FlaG flagellin family)
MYCRKILLLIALLLATVSVIMCDEPIEEQTSGTTTVTINRPTNGMSGRMVVEVLIDGKVVAEVKNGGTANFNVPNGNRKLTIKDKAILNSKGEELNFIANSSPVTFKIEFDERGDQQYGKMKIVVVE